MKISLKASDPLKLSVDILVFLYFEETFNEEISKLPLHLASEIRKSIKRENFKGSKKDSLIISSKGEIEAYKLLIKGLGSKKEITLANLSESVAKTVKIIKQNKCVNAALVISDNILNLSDSNKIIQAIIEALELAAYDFRKYKSSSEKDGSRALEEVFISLSASKIQRAEDGVLTGKIMSKATLYTRDLVNEPSQITTPTYLAEEALKIAKNSKGLIKADILEKADLEDLGMNAFLGVSRGSDEPPKFIILKYKNQHPRKKVVIAGKGITFDTGGLSLKPPVHMETMKLDMAGAATVLGVFSALAELQPNVEITGLIAACENMPSGKALKPGDILKAYNGKTIEVLNTDAEGRLTLADVLSYAALKIKPDQIIDFATLTGACMVALGQDYAGIFANDENLFKDLEKAARETDEKIWRLPLPEEYKELNESKIADIKNIGSGKYAGAITAALFLQEFVNKIPWSHLDIAGPAFMEKDTPMAAHGGSGFGVRLTLNYLNSF